MEFSKFQNTYFQIRISVFYCIIIVLCHCSGTTSASSSESEPLFLTPLIKQGKITEAQKLAQVSLPIHEDVFIKEKEFPKSYAGFLTVKEEYGTNLFFWYFPAKNNSETAPVIFWSDGGPGATLLHSFLNLHGPLKFNEDRKLVLRNDNASLVSEFNVIYLDNPAGVGFSFTGNEAGYAKSGRDTAENIYEFLMQFFKLFPNLKKNDFYNGGGSYGGTYATVIAHKIHERNQKLSAQENDKRINLKGLIMDSPWLHPLDQVDYGTWLYSSGLISKKSKEYFDSKRDEMLKLLKEDKISEAGNAWISVAIMDIISYTGLASFYDYVDQDLDHIALLQYNYTDLVTSTPFRTAIHVGRQEFSMFSPKVQANMMGTFMSSVKDLLEQLLDTGSYRVLMIAGDMDLITGHMGIQEVALNLQWSGGDEFRSQDKQAWMDQNRYSGNIQSSKGLLTYALVRNAGHGAAINQPVKVLELIKGFVRGEIGGLQEKDEEFSTNYFPDLTTNFEDNPSSVREDL